MARKIAGPLSFKDHVVGREQDRASLEPLLESLADEAGAQAYPATLAVGQLRRGPFQPREEISEESVRDMANTIRTVGLLQPLLVRPAPGVAGVYEILAGERRWRAAQLAGLDRVAVVVRSADDDTAAAIGLVENLQREDLNPMEKAAGLRMLVTRFGLSQVKVAEKVGMDRTVVNRLLALLSLAPGVQRLLREGKLEANHGRVLIGLPKSVQEQLAAKAVRLCWSVQALERARKALERHGQAKERGGRMDVDADIRRLETHLAERIGNPVHVRHFVRSGRVKMVMEFASVEEFQGALRRMDLEMPED